MKHIRTAGMALMVVLALSSIASATASASVKPQFLPEATAKVPIVFTDKSGISHFEIKGGSVVTCQKDTSTGEVLGLKLGEFDILFLECESLGIACTGLADTVSGSILVLGEFHVWYVLLSTKLQTGIAFLLKEVHFECGKILLVIRGCMAGLVKPLNKKTNSLITELKQEKGVNDITQVLNEEEKLIGCKLETSINSGVFEPTGAETVEEMVEFKQNGKAIEVEIMA